jgi:hypothetical protein
VDAELSTGESTVATAERAKRRGKKLEMAATPSSLAKNSFRDELCVTGRVSEKEKSLPKQGSGVSLVNQNFRREFSATIN